MILTISFPDRVFHKNLILPVILLFLLRNNLSYKIKGNKEEDFNLNMTGVVSVFFLLFA